MKLPKLPNWDGKWVCMVVILVLIAMTACAAYQNDLPRTLWRGGVAYAAVWYARHRKFF